MMTMRASGKWRTPEDRRKNGEADHDRRDHRVAIRQLGTKTLEHNNPLRNPAQVRQRIFALLPWLRARRLCWDLGTRRGVEVHFAVVSCSRRFFFVLRNLPYRVRTDYDCILQLVNNASRC
ncbi:hypothetical protein BJV78DRAFT_1232139 [Lactifluus subvellereus]|nr:hypothetical protein BJV78DRAFT_1232139 [Lactifluus subvellereus]